MASNHIRISPENYKKLNGMKDQGETFDDAVTKLFGELRECRNELDVLKYEVGE